MLFGFTVFPCCWPTLLHYHLWLVGVHWVHCSSSIERVFSFNFRLYLIEYAYILTRLFFSPVTMTILVLWGWFVGEPCKALYLDGSFMFLRPWHKACQGASRGLFTWMDRSWSLGIKLAREPLRVLYLDGWFLVWPRHKACYGALRGLYLDAWSFVRHSNCSKQLGIKNEKASFAFSLDYIALRLFFQRFEVFHGRGTFSPFIACMC